MNVRSMNTWRQWFSMHRRTRLHCILHLQRAIAKELSWLLGSLGPRPAGSDPSPWIIRILDVDPRLSGVFVRLPREFQQFFEPALAFRNVLFDRKGILVVLVDLEFLPHLVPEVVLVVRHAVADTFQIAAVQG
jgi:hypothetical protein